MTLWITPQHTDLSPRWITSILSISEGYHQHVPGLVSRRMQANEAYRQICQGFCLYLINGELTGIPLFPKLRLIWLCLVSSPRTSQPSLFSNFLPSSTTNTSYGQISQLEQPSALSNQSQIEESNLGLQSLHLDAETLFKPTRGRWSLEASRTTLFSAILPRLFHST